MSYLYSIFYSLFSFFSFILFFFIFFFFFFFFSFFFFFLFFFFFFFFSSRRRHTRSLRDWSSDVCSSDLPPVSAMVGLLIDDVQRHGKFLDISAQGVHLVIHLARAGWLRWKEEQNTGLVRPGKGPIALRTVLDDGSGFDLTEAGTQKKLAVYVVRDVNEVPGIARL